MAEKGYQMVIGETTWKQDKARSASAAIRGKEFMDLILAENIDLIIPPWGGNLLSEVLEEIKFDKIPEKWVLGYSDLSTLLLSITLRTGVATAHGPNLVDLRGEFSDPVTKQWETALTTQAGASFTQFSSEKFQKEWNHANPSPCIFHLTEKTEWKTIDGNEINIKGRVLAGCIDTSRHIIGTPYGNLKNFRAEFTKDEPIIWVLENCELSTVDLRRSLIQMKYAGWFENCAGILFGRSACNKPVGAYELEDVYQDLTDELKLPVAYDIDSGHVPPQMTFINGALAEVQVKDGKGKLIQHFI
jgi:muramoyltetrapeptide carboxypeptidase LdcA involved in peptidoglycan recycling